MSLIKLLPFGYGKKYGNVQGSNQHAAAELTKIEGSDKALELALNKIMV